jgi:hypothetical protein
MHVALKARQARMRRGVEEMQRQVRRFSRTLEKMRSPAAPSDKARSAEQPAAQGDASAPARRAS